MTRMYSTTCLKLSSGRQYNATSIGWARVFWQTIFKQVLKMFVIVFVVSHPEIVLLSSPISPVPTGTTDVLTKDT